MASGQGFDSANTADWRWTLMLFQPEYITSNDFEKALASLKAKRPDASFNDIRLETFNEGEAVQIMHIGPYADEARSIRLLEECAKENGYRLRGKHHEIYLGDPRRTKPENLKTILRHPVTSLTRESTRRSTKTDDSVT